MRAWVCAQFISHSAAEGEQLNTQIYEQQREFELIMRPTTRNAPSWFVKIAIFIGKLRQDPWFEFLAIFDFLHHGIEKVERHLLWKFHNKNSKEKLVKCATEVARLHRVSIQSCTQNGRLRKFNRAREIEFNFFTVKTMFMKFSTLVHHVHGYKTIASDFFSFCLGT